MDREEALKKVQQMSLPKETMEILEALAPELAESEDEKIRKFLVKHVSEWIGCIEHDLKLTSKDVESEEELAMFKAGLAYLEKQKVLAEHGEGIYYYHSDGFTFVGCPTTEASTLSEPLTEKQKENPKSEDSIPSDCTSDVKCEDRWHKVTDSLPDNGRLVLAKDCLGNVLLARYDGENWEVNVYDNEDHYCHNSISKWCEIPSEKQKEQKPVEYLDKDKIYAIMKKLNDLSFSKDILIYGKEYKLIGEITRDVRSLLDYPINQQPAEWSEKDEEKEENIMREKIAYLRDLGLKNNDN